MRFNNFPDANIHKVVRHFFEKHNNFLMQKDTDENILPEKWFTLLR